MAPVVKYPENRSLFSRVAKTFQPNDSRLAQEYPTRYNTTIRGQF